MSAFKAFFLGVLVAAIGFGLFHYVYCLAPVSSVAADSGQVTPQAIPQAIPQATPQTMPKITPQVAPPTALHAAPQANGLTTRRVRLSAVSRGEWKVLFPHLSVHAGDRIAIRAEPEAESSTRLSKATSAGGTKSRQGPDCRVGIRIGINGQEVMSNQNAQFNGDGVPCQFVARTDGDIYIALFGSDPTWVFIEVGEKKRFSF